VPRPGTKNLITDVAGLTVGHATDEAAGTGVTVLLCGADWAAGVDVRGGGPGVRESETLAAENLVGRAHAIVLAGGSVFGLAAADGVASALSGRGVGLHLKRDSLAIPIVPAAVLHDLGNGGNKDWGRFSPYRELGYVAAQAGAAQAGAAQAAGSDVALANDFALGSVGGGTGATTATVKGGLGSASARTDAGHTVGAIAIVNAVGSPLIESIS